MIKKRRVCDLCKTPDSRRNRVSPFRWMRVMDKYNYKHKMLIKIDLCDGCSDFIGNEISDLLIPKNQ